MHLYQRQQFDFLLMTSAERFVERITQRNEGAANALRKLQADANGEGIWLDEFVGVLFEDFLLNNTAGACFVLEALEKRTVPDVAGGKIELVLQLLARRAFADLLKQKVEEVLSRTWD